MKMRIMLDAGAYAPERAHKTDAGLDIKSPKDTVVPAHGSRLIGTGVHIELPENTVGMLKSKSGLNVKHGIVSEGVIDEGYNGEIITKLYNHSEVDYKINAGDKITQLVVIPCLYVEPEIVESIASGERGSAGFGSTGR